MKKRKYKKLKQEYKILAESYLAVYEQFKESKEEIAVLKQALRLKINFFNKIKNKSNK